MKVFKKDKMLYWVFMFYYWKGCLNVELLCYLELMFLCIIYVDVKNKGDSIDSLILFLLLDWVFNFLNYWYSGEEGVVDKFVIFI